MTTLVGPQSSCRVSPRSDHVRRNLAKQYPRKAIGNASGLTPILEGGLTHFGRVALRLSKGGPRARRQLRPRLRVDSLARRYEVLRDAASGFPLISLLCATIDAVAGRPLQPTRLVSREHKVFSVFLLPILSNRDSDCAFRTSCTSGGNCRRRVCQPDARSAGDHRQDRKVCAFGECSLR